MSRQRPYSTIDSDEEYDDMNAPLVEAGQGGDDDDTMTTVEAAADVSDDEPNVGKHVSKDWFGNKMTVRLNIDVDASPEQLAANPELANWGLKQELHKLFKQNIADKDRSNAADDQLVGNVDQIVPLEARIVGHQNTLPYAMDLKCKHFVPASIHRHGSGLHYIPPGTETATVNGVLLQPNNILDERMYRLAQECSLEELDEDIKLTLGTKSRPGFATVVVGTAAHEKLLSGLKKHEWRHIKVTDQEWAQIFEAPEYARSVTIPLKLGEALKSDLQKNLQDVIGRCISAEDFTFSVVRADGLGFAAAQNLHGMLVGSGIDDNQQMAAEILGRSSRAHFAMDFTFFTMGDRPRK